MKVSQYTPQQRIDHARECLEGMTRGKTIKSYAIEQGIIPRTLQNWIKKYRKHTAEQTESATTLVKIQRPRKLQSDRVVETSSLKVSFGSLAVELPAGNSDHDLKRVLAALKEVI